MITRLRALLAAGLACIALIQSPARAAAVTDCPLRDAPFSTASPLVDLLLNAQATALVTQYTGLPLDRLPPFLVATTPPTFAAIVTVPGVAMMAKGRVDQIDALDAALRRLPVTAADRRARCARYDNEVPRLTLPAGRPRLLLFEKIVGFRDGPSVAAAHAAIVDMAQRNGWALAVTDRAGAFNPRTLRQFDAVIWNNISGDVLTLSQRAAFRRYIETGGGFAGFHGTAGDPVYFWDWYADRLIGARFLGHPTDPQFQEARIVVDPTHPLAATLRGEWRMTDEWYSFRTNPRKAGARVLLSLDEATYNPSAPMFGDLKMGDHPLAWTNCVGHGRMFYSAIGHLPESYRQPQLVAMMEAALKWVALERAACR